MPLSNVVLSRSTKKRIAHYASTTGQTASAVANEAINTWMDTFGDVITEELASPTGACEIVNFPLSAS